MIITSSQLTTQSVHRLQLIMTIFMLGLTSMLQPDPVQAKSTYQAGQSSLTDEARFSQTLTHIENELQTLEYQLAHGQNVKNALNGLKQQRQVIKNLSLSIKQNFNRVKQHLQQHGMSDTLKKRHITQVENYQQELDILLDNLQSILDANNKKSHQQGITQALAQLQKKHKGKVRGSFSSDILPFKQSPIKVRPPREKADDFVSLFYDRKPIQLAALTLDGSILSNTYQPAGLPEAQDLAAAGDAIITPEIQALANTLNKQPVAIFNWVYNNIGYVPSYGSLQGSAYTLKTRHGNAFDTASLLIALLRASDIPARYSYGTVVIPIAQMQTWMGASKPPEDIISLLQQGGIPSQAIIEGGVITRVKMEHVWVDAWVDYEPSRGAINRVGDSWVPLDASFKRKDILSGVEWSTLAGFDADTFANQLISGSNYDTDWVSSMDAILLQDTLQVYSTRLQQALIEAEQENASLGELLGGARLIEQNSSLLASGLPYYLLARAPDIATLPDSLRYQYSLALYTDTTQRALGQASIKHELHLPELANHRVALSFVPANQETLNLINSYLPEAILQGSINPAELPDSLPGYLLEVNAELSVDGIVVGTAGPFEMGTRLILESNIISPTLGQERALSYPVAGEYRALGWDLQGGLSQDIRDTAARLTTTEEALSTANISGFDRHHLSGDVLRASLQLYFAANDLYGNWQSRFSDALFYRAPSFGAASSALVTDWLFGLPRSVHFKGIALDLDRLRVQAISGDNDLAATAQFKQQLGRLGSALAHVVLEHAFSDGDSAGISSVRAMASALQNNQRLYSLTGVTFRITRVLTSQNIS